LTDLSTRYTPKQLYAIVADTDNYQRFIPFVTSSKVIRHDGPGDMQDRPWVDLDNGAGDTHKMDHEMSIGVMGFDENWVSHVTCEKFRSVSVGSSL
jgi:ribosome-associated toxin RatA of RatAB toxin-antitoxin module